MGLLAVNYHYVGGKDFPFPGVNGLTVEKFRLQIEFLKQRYNLISFDELPGLTVPCLKETNYCLITFDDGLKSHYTTVFRLIQEMNVPATFFVCSLPLFELRALNVHKSQIVRALNPPEMIEQELESFTSEQEIPVKEINEALVREHYRYDQWSAARVKYLLNYVLSSEQQKYFVDSLFDKTGLSEEKFINEWYLTADELSTMSQVESICIGSHAHTHRALSQLEANSCRTELQQSKQLLEKQTGRPVICLSYPYGGEGAVSRREADFASEAGYRYAVTMEREFNRTVADPLLLARIDCNDLPQVGKSPRFQYVKGNLWNLDGSEPHRKRYFVE